MKIALLCAPAPKPASPAPPDGGDRAKRDSLSGLRCVSRMRCSAKGLRSGAPPAIAKAMAGLLTCPPKLQRRLALIRDRTSRKWLTDVQLKPPIARQS